MRTKEDQYNAHLRQIIEYCMVSKGKNRNKCFRCRTKLTNKNRQIHHLKYENATVSDLEFGCQSCNMRAQYLNLK